MSGQHLRTTKSFQAGDALPVNTLRSFGAIFFACCLTFQHPSIAQQTSAPSATCHVYFSPHGGATGAISHAIENAKESLLVQAYSFTSVPIAERLIRAHKRGVKVQVLLDRSQRSQKYSTFDFLISAGIPTLIDAAHAIAHNKIMIIDNEMVITGSFNFTKAAEEKNAENLLVIHSRQLAAQYSDNWRNHAAHSESFSSSVVRTDRATSQKHRARF